MRVVRESDLLDSLLPIGPGLNRVAPHWSTGRGTGRRAEAAPARGTGVLAVSFACLCHRVRRGLGERFLPLLRSGIPLPAVVIPAIGSVGIVWKRIPCMIRRVI